MAELDPTLPAAVPAPLVYKTAKAWVNGAFIRSESGRTFRVHTLDGTAHDVVDLSRKDARDAIRAGAAAAAGWQAASPYLRGQILYRCAEMLAGASGLDALEARLGRTPSASTAAAARFVHYAGWTDKVAMVLGSANPVHGHASTSTPTGVGLTAVWVPEAASVLDLVDAIAPALAAANAVCVVAPGAAGLLATALAEHLAVADVPAGVCQLLPSTQSDTMRTFAGSSVVRALDVVAHPDRVALEQLAAESLTRCKTAHTLPGSEPAVLHSLAAIRWQVDLRTTVTPTAR